MMQLVSSGVIETQVLLNFVALSRLMTECVLLHLQWLLRRACPPFWPFFSHTSPQRVRAQGWNVRISHNDFIDQYSKLFY
jgi:hypothetical protein